MPAPCHSALRLGRIPPLTAFNSHAMIEFMLRRGGSGISSGDYFAGNRHLLHLRSFASAFSTVPSVCKHACRLSSNGTVRVTTPCRASDRLRTMSTLAVGGPRCSRGLTCSRMAVHEYRVLARCGQRRQPSRVTVSRTEPVTRRPRSSPFMPLRAEY